MKIKKITRKTPLRDLIQIGPSAIEILFEEGMHCIGCPMSMQENLEQGCLAHGMSLEQVELIVKKLNNLIKKNE